MKIALDTNVIVSHLKGDQFAEDTRGFLEWSKETIRRERSQKDGDNVRVTSRFTDVDMDAPERKHEGTTHL